MSLEDIQKKIISDAEQKKAELIATAEKQSVAIIEQAKKEAKKYAEEHEKNALSSAENLQRGLVIDARRKLANEILATKRKRIEQVFHKSKTNFMVSTDYPEMMKNLVVKSVVSKKEAIIVGVNEKILDQKWLDTVNQVCGGSLTFAKQNGNFEGGIILADGDTFVNISLDTIISILRQDTEKPVADILFRG